MLKCLRCPQAARNGHSMLDNQIRRAAARCGMRLLIHKVVGSIPTPPIPEVLQKALFTCATLLAGLGDRSSRSQLEQLLRVHPELGENRARIRPEDERRRPHGGRSV